MITNKFHPLVNLYDDADLNFFHIFNEPVPVDDDDIDDIGAVQDCLAEIDMLEAKTAELDAFADLCEMFEDAKYDADVRKLEREARKEERKFDKYYGSACNL